MSESAQIEAGHEEAVAQYVHYGESVVAHGQRTDTANRFYLTLLTALLAGAGIAVERSIELTSLQVWLYVITGVSIALLWAATLQSHRAYNSVKYETIQEMEEKLPLRPYSVEFRRLGERSYQPIGRLMIVLPMVFIAVFIALGITFL